MLSVIDQHWREHLYEMDYLQRGHQPPGDGPAGPARRVAARGLRHVRGDDGADRGRLRPVRLPPPGRRSRSSPAAPLRNVQYSARRGPGAGLERRCAAAAAACRPRSSSAASMPAPAAGREPVPSRRGRAQEPVRVEKTPGPQRAVLLRERQEVQALPRPLTAGRPSRMRDFSDDLADLRRRVEDARVVPARSTTRARASWSSRARSSRPDLWDDPDRGAQGHDRARARCRDDVELVDELERPRLRPRDARPSSAARRATTRSSRRSTTGVARARGAARPARAARAVHRRARRARRDLRGALRRGRHRRAGLDRDAAAHVHAVGASDAASTSSSTRSSRARRRASRRRRSS